MNELVFYFYVTLSIITLYSICEHHIVEHSVCSHNLHKCLALMFITKIMQAISCMQNTNNMTIAIVLTCILDIIIGNKYIMQCDSKQYLVALLLYRISVFVLSLLTFVVTFAIIIVMIGIWFMFIINRYKQRA